MKRAIGEVIDVSGAAARRLEVRRFCNARASGRMRVHAGALEKAGSRCLHPAIAARRRRHPFCTVPAGPAMHELSVRLSSKRLYIADLAAKLESMETGRWR
jgi:hypothetical protein